MHDPEHPMTNTPNEHTDLPLSPCGNNGNEVGAFSDVVEKIARLFREMVEALAEPPYELVDTAAVVDWIKRAAAGAARRRERERLLREAEHVLWNDWASLLAAERKRAQLVRAAANLEAREAGTYWRDRDGHRSSTLATHVLVDREAWQRARVEATSNRLSVGVVVGHLVAAEVRLPGERNWQRDADRDRSHEVRLFARLAVSREIYGNARLMASAAEVTVERFLGVLVEEAFPCSSPPAAGRRSSGGSA